MTRKKFRLSPDEQQTQFVDQVIDLYDLVRADQHNHRSEVEIDSSLLTMARTHQIGAITRTYANDKTPPVGEKETLVRIMEDIVSDAAQQETEPSDEQICRSFWDRLSGKTRGIPPQQQLANEIKRAKEQGFHGDQNRSGGTVSR